MRNRPGMPKPWWLLWLILMTFFIMTACAESQMPNNLMGVWVSKHERYKHCFMEIKRDTIVFGANSTVVDAGTVEKVSRKTNGAQSEYLVTYANQENGHFSVTLVYSEESGGTLKFQNQPQVVWHRFSTSRPLPL